MFESKPFVTAAASIVGPKEGVGPLGHCFDVVLEDDLLGMDTWEQAESEMMRRTAQMALERAGLTEASLGVMLCGDLLNQIIASGFAGRALGVPFMGLYGACSTMIESMILGAVLVEGGYRQNALCTASSHFCAAERQYRFPLELGNQRPPSAQWTATACGALVIEPEAKKALARVTHGTIGAVVDYQIKDANHMGAAMAPAVADTLTHHFQDTGRDAADFDLIVTGDLGYIGRNLLHELMKERGIHIPDEKLIDCGASLFKKEQDTHAGASGCGCIASVLCGKFLKEMSEGRHGRILALGSGAMLSPTSSMQGESIPSISYGVALEAM